MALFSLGYFEIFLAIICFFYLRNLRSFKRLAWKLPILGTFPYLIMNIHRIHDKCAEVLEKTRGTYHLKGPSFANMDILGTVDPANVHYIMSSNFVNFPKGPEFKKIFEVLGDGIFNSDLDLWKCQRKLARALLNHQSFHKFLVSTSWNKVEKGLIPILDYVAKQGLMVDLQDVFQRLTFDTTCKFVTGYDPGCLSIDFPGVPFSKAMDEVEEAIFMRHILPEIVLKLERWLGIGQEKKLSKSWKILDEVICKYISVKQEELKKGTKSTNDEEGFDLLTSYINLGDNEITTGLKRDDKFLRDTIINFMIAGRDTTSSALTWFIWLVSTHPTVLNKIREELKSVIQVNEEAENFRLFKVDELKNLVYIHAALCESMRLYPPVPFQHKFPLQPDTLPSGHRVHPKIKVIFSLYAMGRMKFIWGKDSWEFKPERWISERGTIKHEPSYKFLAFNAGPRTCLGKEVAFTQMKAVAAAMIHNYNVEMVEGHPVVPNLSVILYMKHGLKVRVSKRWA
ncbi:alkane hydroxylase MAH1 [Coffea arabica]|uniref:Alkane hydroxylase MAH1 n=1 Tax=Coffea arabica TaxID=13443 RepID=A0A6P6TGZ3_COFAR